MNESPLRPYRGFFSPGLYFTSGHAMRLYNFTSAPTEVAAFFQLWLMTPEDKQVLYVDPEAAGGIVATWYYFFDETFSASISWEWRDGDTLHTHMEAVDGTIFDLHMGLGSSLATGLLNTIVKITPQPLMRTRPMLAISDASFNLLLGLGGVHIAGKTETGKTYRTEADRLALVKHASATLDGEDLGPLTPPPEPLFFGPSRVADRPIFAFGTVYLEDA
jgi:hypothetical protein